MRLIIGDNISNNNNARLLHDFIAIKGTPYTEENSNGNFTGVLEICVIDSNALQIKKKM